LGRVVRSCLMRGNSVTGDTYLRTSLLLHPASPDRRTPSELR
jgi:hypothetical protein